MSLHVINSTRLPVESTKHLFLVILLQLLQLLTSRLMRLLRGSGMASLALAFHCKRISSCLLAKSRRGGIGRRAGLKIQYWQQCVGSIPSVGRVRQRPALHVWNAFLVCGAVGLRSRATGVARPGTHSWVCDTFYGRATPDARERIPTTPHARPRHTCNGHFTRAGHPFASAHQILFSSTS